MKLTHAQLRCIVSEVLGIDDYSPRVVRDGPRGPVEMDDNDVVNEIVDEVSLVFYKQVMKNFSSQHLKPGTIEGMLKRLEPMVRDLIKELV